MSERDTEKDMDAAVQCLYIAVDKSVADDVFSRWIAYKADRRQRIAQLEARVAKLERRLEISFCFDADGNEQEIPPERRDAFPDGISARDETIRLLEAEVARLTAMQDAYKVAALENANTRIMELEAELARVKGVQT